MKSITLKRTFILLLIGALAIVSYTNAKKMTENTQQNLRTENSNSNKSKSKQSTDPNAQGVTYKTPEIDTNRKINSGDKKYEPVKYVKQISAAGKAALELQASGE